eukprot:TRINITY_DN5215_c0_g1_i1.p1 TRINITY_DN5215_c0_g1~~TRINITY_DN5215_c0_g1_i1.p1  ORF type:complete len:468 (+),score=102.34 TRINITY_DN5215_c0_g1_i1:95-1405(+)
MSMLSLPISFINSLDSWKSLKVAHKSNAPRLVKLSPQIQRNLMLGLVSLSLGDSQEEQCHYVADMVLPVGNAFMIIIKNDEFVSKAQLAKSAVELQLCRMRGILRATKTATQPAVWAFTQQILTPLIDLFRLYRENEETVLLVLRLWGDIVKYLIDVSSVDQKNILFAHTSKLFDAVKQSKLITTTTAANPQKINHVSRVCCAILKIIRTIAPYSIVNSANASFFGLAVIYPGLTPTFLRMQDFSVLYYSVLKLLCNHHTTILSQIPLPLFKGILDSLDDAFLGVYQLGTFSCVLETIILVFTPEVVSRVRDNRSYYSNEANSELHRFVHPLLTKLITSIATAYPQLRNLAANTYYATICYSPQLYEEWERNLLAEMPPNTSKSVVQMAFLALRDAIQNNPVFDGGSPVFSQVQRREFAGIFDTFLSRARSLLKRK